jgi:hypothetical protein
VSKPCCSICTDVLSIFRGLTDLKGINNRGRHPVYSAVQVPSWLPDTIMSEVLRRLDYNLYRDIMILTGGKTHGRNPSGQSDSGLSVASAKSGSSINTAGFPEVQEI